MKSIEKFTFGMGDRFAHEGTAQLKAIQTAWDAGISIYPVWNKSNREHTIVKSEPQDLRREAEQAVAALGWDRSWYVDADHINLKTVDRFVGCSTFFTIDVAEEVGATPRDPAEFHAFMQPWMGEVSIPGIGRPIVVSQESIDSACAKFLAAMRYAGEIYRHIETAKAGEDFITEVSVDETDSAQSPEEMLLILAMLAMEKVPVQTIAPKFTGRFNKGVDYVGDLAAFEREMDEDLCVIAFAVREFGLPSSLKLSVHSGSDKFSLYPIINRLLKKHGAGLHVKTAGTTWIEEIIGLAEVGGEGLAIAQDVYAGAYGRFDELTAPYATVIDCDRAHLPTPEDVRGWSAEQLSAALRHVPGHPQYNLHMRQLIHVAFKVAAEMGPRFTDALIAHREAIARNVTHNLWARHMEPIFSGL